MNSKIFVGMLLLAAGLLVGWYLLGIGFSPEQVLKNTINNKNESITPKKNPTPTEISSESGQPLEKGGQAARLVVTYTDTGFAPSPIQISKGETVVFVNESTKQMQVASAVFPMHQVLPSFVQKTTVGKGGVYEYTFSTIGTWKYQNDQMPSDSGSVIVK